MKKLLMLSALAALVSFTAVPADAILYADFEAKVADQAIGTNGAIAGEPVSQNSVGTVRNGPFPSKCLEYTDNVTSGTGISRFEFMDSEEVTTGVLTITAELWFNELDNFYFSVREQGTSSKSFNSIRFVSGGTVHANDAVGTLGSVATYTAGRAYPLRLVHNLETGIYDLWWDNVLVVSNRAHGITDRGIGGLLTGFSHDSNETGTMYIDNILVVKSEAVTAEAVSWGQTKALFD